MQQFVYYLNKYSVTTICIVGFAYELVLCLSVYDMCCLCMIATIPLVTGNKFNCFISARGMLAINPHCAFVLLLFFFVFFCVVGFFYVVFFVDFYMLINHLLKKSKLCLSIMHTMSVCLFL